MALSLDRYVVANLSSHVDLQLDFVGTISEDATDVTECETSSGWSECVVNTYHLCAQDAAQASVPGWWTYSVCMYRAQYPDPGSTSTHYLECAGMNPVHPIVRNQSCTKAEFPGIVEEISNSCAREAGLDAAKVQACATSTAGLELLKRSMNASSHFPLSVMLKVEPQWIMVDGPPSCSADKGGWKVCKPFFDKTECEDWGHCNSDKWAMHLRNRVCNNSGVSPCN